MKKKLNRRNKLAGWLIGAVCMVLLGGCGKKQDGTTEAVTTAEPAVVATNADAAKEPDLPMDAEVYYITNDYVKTLGETINVRVAASTDADIYKLLPGGEILNRVGYNEEWTKVMVDGSTFYVYSEYVIQTEPPAGTLPDTTEEETPTDTATKSISGCCECGTVRDLTEY